VRFNIDLLPSFLPQLGLESGGFVHCYPTLDHSGLEFSASPHCYPSLDHLDLEFSALLRSGGLVAPAEFASKIGGIFPIALCGLSSL
jgi:hypothetical protein